MTKRSADIYYYPVSLAIDGRKCLVIGGGQVALRKVEALLEHGAAVTVASPRLDDGLRRLAAHGKVITIDRDYRPGDMDGFFMAIVATDSAAINRAAAEEARQKHVLVNVADDAGKSDFITPSHVRRGPVSIAISTSGKSPALARKLRVTLEQEFGEEYARLAELLGEIRAEVLERGLKIKAERWQEAIDLDTLIKLLKQGKYEKARETVMEKLGAGSGTR